MPKIIEALQEKILDTALRLFTTESYDTVDMRRIAKDTGIAIGTLYNYFSSKQDLLLAVVENSWQESFHRLESGMVQMEQATDSITVFLRLIYQEFLRNKNLDIIRIQLMRPKQMKAADPMRSEQMRRSFVRKISPLLHKAVCQQYPLAEGALCRMVEMLPVLVQMLDMAHGDTPEENLQFLSDLVHGYIRTQIEHKDFTGEHV